MSAALRHLFTLPLFTLSLTVLSAAACSSTSSQYRPQLTAAGELTLSYEGKAFVARRGDREVARGRGWQGLAHEVRCVPMAHRLALEAAADGRTALGLAVSGGVLGGVAPAALLGFLSSDVTTRISLLAAGVGVAITGTILAALSNRYKNRSNGKAVDAINFYNDEQGAWGGSCDAPLPAFDPPQLQLDGPAEEPPLSGPRATRSDQRPSPHDGPHDGSGAFSSPMARFIGPITTSIATPAKNAIPASIMK